VFEYARRQVLDPGEAVTQFEWSDGCISLTKNQKIV
jgi:hypothetical protein